MDKPWPVPAAHALIAWDTDRNAVGVGRLLDRLEGDWTDAYESTGGAAETRRRSLPSHEQKFQVFLDFYRLVYVYGISPEVVHRAFLNIREFQDAIKAEGMGPDKHEPGHDAFVGYGRACGPGAPVQVSADHGCEHISLPTARGETTT